MEPVELLQGDPQSWPGVHKLLAAVKVAAELLAQEIDQQIHQTPVPPSNVQAEIDAKKQQLKALDARIVALSKRSGEGELIRPAWEQRALERLFEVGVRRERELASQLDEDLLGRRGLVRSALRRRPARADGLSGGTKTSLENH